MTPPKLPMTTVLLIFWTWERVPNDCNVVLVLVVGVDVFIFSTYEKMFTSKPIVNKLRLPIVKNIHDFCTVSDF